MRNRNTRVVRTAAAIAIAASLTVGAGATAVAQPAADGPAMPAAAGSSGAADVVAAGERVQIGENIRADGFHDVLYEAALYKQVTSGETVAPGGEVTMRLEAEGIRGTARVQQLHNSMPAGFELVSVARVDDVDGAETVSPLSSGEYRFRDLGEDGTRVEVTFGNSEHERPQIKEGETVTLEYVYRAPRERGSYGHGGHAYLSWAGSGYPMNGGAATGARAIEVAEPPAGSAGFDWDSILGSLGLDSIDFGSLDQGDEDEDVN